MTSFKANNTGRSTNILARSRDKKKAQQWPDEPFVQHGQSFFTSVAWKVLSSAAKQIYWRINVEHMAHGGRENGRLPCTYTDFEKYGVRRKSISKALDELVALGFIEITRKGHLRPEGDSGAPSQYRITCIPVYKSDGVERATNEWRRFETVADAKQAVAIYHESASTERGRRYYKRKRNKIKPETGAACRDENHIPRGSIATELEAETPLR